jgi:hypothetical protein
VVPIVLKEYITSISGVEMKVTRLHGATTQKTAIFILAAARTSNPTKKTTIHIFTTLKLSDPMSL